MVLISGQTPCSAVLRDELLLLHQLRQLLADLQVRCRQKVPQGTENSIGRAMQAGAPIVLNCCA